MPYKRYIRKPNRRVGLRKKNWYNKKYSVTQLARKAYRGVKYIKSLINVEKNFFDTNRAFSSQNSSPTISNLSNIGQGDDYNSRQGNSILLQSLLFRAIMIGDTSGGVAGGHLLRLIIFRDNDQRGTDPVASDLLENTGSSLIVTSPLLHTVYDRFSILMDKVYTLNSFVTSGDSAIPKYVKKFIKFPPGMHIRYQGSSASDASNYEGALYLLAVSTDASLGPGLQWNCRIRYTDN